MTDHKSDSEIVYSEDDPSMIPCNYVNRSIYSVLGTTTQDFNKGEIGLNEEDIILRIKLELEKRSIPLSWAESVYLYEGEKFISEASAVFFVGNHFKFGFGFINAVAVGSLPQIFLISLPKSDGLFRIGPRKDSEIGNCQTFQHVSFRSKFSDRSLIRFQNFVEAFSQIEHHLKQSEYGSFWVYKKSNSSEQ